MKKSGKCPKCGGTHIIADAVMVDRDSQAGHKEMTAATFRKPAGLIFKGKQDTTVSAWVCAACGYLELYADHPLNLILPKT